MIDRFRIPITLCASSLYQAEPFAVKGGGFAADSEQAVA
jgi:hypothetical protein